MVLIRDVDVPSRINEHVLGLGHQFGFGQRSAPLDWVGWYEISDFPRKERIRDVENPQSSIEIGEEDRILIVQ